MCELRNQRDTRKRIDLVWLWFRNPHDKGSGKNDTDFRTATPGADQLTAGGAPIGSAIAVRRRRTGRRQLIDRSLKLVRG
jgi:hypothetical protein